MSKTIKIVIFLILLLIILAIVSDAKSQTDCIAERQAFEDEWLDTDLVSGVGITERDGKCALYVLTENLSSWMMLPESAEEVPIVYDFVGDIRPVEDKHTGRYRPVVGGSSISDEYRFIAGTMGAVLRGEDGNKYGLTNNHVIAAQGDNPIGTAVVQPGRLDGGIVGQDNIGTMTDFEPIQFVFRLQRPTNIMDAAIFKLSVSSFNNVIDIGPITGARDPYLNAKVRKSGRNGFFSGGHISSTNMTVEVYYGRNQMAIFKNQFTVSGEEMCIPGDSGSIYVYEGLQEAAGLLFAGGTEDHEFGIASPIGPILSRFHLYFSMPPKYRIILPTVMKGLP